MEIVKKTKGKDNRYLKMETRERSIRQVGNYSGNAYECMKCLEIKRTIKWRVGTSFPHFLT